jgi:thiamine-phosphate pyrophosphorylase
MSKKSAKSSKKSAKPAAPPADAPRLSLISPILSDEAGVERLAALTQGGRIAAVTLRFAELDERALQRLAAAYAGAAQAGGAAALVPYDADTRLVGRAGLDGVQVQGLDRLDEALAALRPDRIVGVGGLASRDDAMTAGEKEPDYVSIGEPAADGFVRPLDWRIERAQWWAELFTLPCAVYVAAREEIAPLAQTGADVLTFGPWLWEADDALAVLADADAALAAHPSP